MGLFFGSGKYLGMEEAWKQLLGNISADGSRTKHMQINWVLGCVGRPPSSLLGPHLKLEHLHHTYGLPFRKLVIIGDGACGKTSLLSVFTLGYFPTVGFSTFQTQCRLLTCRAALCQSTNLDITCRPHAD